MDEISHDPSEYIRGIQQILISDKKKIGFLFGAGSSLARKNNKSLVVPAIGQMTTDIVTEIGDVKNNFKKALASIKLELSDNYNIETILSNLELKSKLIGDGDTLNSLNKTEFEELIIKIKEKVREKVSVHKTKNDDDPPIEINVTRKIIEQLVQTDFAEWIGQAERKYPIEIFTTNYDFLFELGLEYKEIPYYDGFCGSFRPFFNPESVEDLNFLSNQTKIWKIHGSLGWHYDDETEKILRVHPDDNDILIYPSSLKYKDSKKQPYESLMDRLSNFLKQDDTILITCGYSWSDEHINSRIVSALKTNTTSHVIGMIYDKYWDDKKKDYQYSFTKESALAKIGFDNSKISIYAYRNALIGCKYGDWKLKSEPDKEDTVNINLYFDEDAHSDKGEALETEKIGEEFWTGKGEFKLPDFSKLSIFLNSMINENEIRQLGKDAKK